MTKLLLLLAGLVAAMSAATPAAARAYPFDPARFPAYRLTVRLDRPTQVLDAEGEVRVARDLLQDGRLVVALSETAADVRFTTPDGGQLQLVKRPGDPSPPELRRWLVDLPASAAGSGPVTVRFRYRIVRANTTLYGIGDSGAFASGAGTAWYPEIERSDGGRMPGLGRLEVAAGKDRVIAGGRAFGPASFRLETPQFFDFAAGPYHEVPSRNGRSRLFLLGAHPDAAGFAEKLESTVSALERELGPLPQRRFDLVEAPADLARKAGFDGASLDGFMMATGFYFDQPFNTAFFGHEISHQWWGALVRRKGPSGAYLLDESLAQFGSLRAVETVEGEAAAELYRRRGFPGYYAEYSGYGYLARSLAGIDAPLSNLPIDDGFVARRVANAKGVLVWSMLADTMGRERFSGFLRRFAQAHAYERVTLDGFMAELRAAMGADAWFLDEWFSGLGAPELALDWRPAPGGVEVTIRQSGRAFRVRTPVRLVLKSGATIDRAVDAAGPSTTAVLPVEGEVQAVVLDPDWRLLRWTPELRAEAEALLPYTRADIELNYGRFDKAQAGFDNALAGLTGPDPHGLRARLERGLGDLLVRQDRPGGAEHYRRALAATPQPQDQVVEVWRGLANALRLAGDEAGARAAAQAGASAITAQLQRKAELQTSAFADDVTKLKQ